MLSLDPAGYSTRWYKDFFTNLNWQGAVKNSVIIAFFATILATVLGTVAALGLSRAHMPFRTTVMGLLISPMIVPLIISAAGMYFFYSKVGLQGSFLGVILAHTALGTPFVVITVTATLVGFDHSLTRAAASLGAPPAFTFFKVIVPLILPGVISGAAVRVRDVVRRSGGHPVRRELRAADHSLADVLRHPGSRSARPSSRSRQSSSAYPSSFSSPPRCCGAEVNGCAGLHLRDQLRGAFRLRAGREEFFGNRVARPFTLPAVALRCPPAATSTTTRRSRDSRRREE